jgi:hypothetical protein
VTDYLTLLVFLSLCFLAALFVAVVWVWWVKGRAE